MCIALSPVFPYLLDWTYPTSWGQIGFIQEYLGTKLNFMHRTMIVFILCSLSGILFSKNSEAKTEFCWDALVDDSKSLKSALKKAGLVILFSCLLASLIYFGILPRIAGAILSFGMLVFAFVYHCKQFPREVGLLADDRFIAGVVCIGTSTILYLF